MRIERIGPLVLRPSENVSQYANTNPSVSSPSVISGTRCDGSFQATSAVGAADMPAGRSVGETCGTGRLTHGDVRLEELTESMSVDR